MIEKGRFNIPIIIILCVFAIAQTVNIFLPHRPVWDERLFFGVVKQFGRNYLPTLDMIRTMDSPMGPVYFTVYGLIGKLVDFSIPVMRSFHIVLSLALLLIINRLLAPCRNRTLLIIVFILNPYFLIMTGPLLYTDVLGLVLIYAGVVNAMEGGNKILTGLVWGLAICTRQLLIIIPLAALLSNAYLAYTDKKKPYKDLILDSIPLLMFVPLFCLWGFNVNSGTFHKGAFEENTLKAFSFSLRALNYTIILIGIYAFPALYRHFIDRLKRPNAIIILIAIALCVSAFPLNVNQDLLYGNLPRTAGLLDIALNRISYLSVPVVPLLLYWGLVFLVELGKWSTVPGNLFPAVCVIGFIALESIYSYCWDKHFLTIIPVVLFISDKIAAQVIKTDNHH